MQGAVAGLVFLAVLVIFAIIVVAKSVALIPQAEAAVIERLGRYSRTVSGQLTLLVPFIDRVRARVDLRERVVSFPPQPVITEDNLTLNIDTVVYFQVTVPQAAVYEISNYIVGVEQLTTTTLRNVVGGMTLEQTLTSRDRVLASRVGVGAITALVQGQRNVMVGIRNHEIVYVPFIEAVQKRKGMNPQLIQVLNKLSI